MLRSAPVAAHRFVVAAAVLLAVGALGCSDRACFRVSRNTAQCPPASGAKDRFGDCSNIESIDSDGALVNGNLCCYDVTHSLDGIPGPGPCPGMGGAPSRSSSGDIAPGDHVATSSGMGGMGGVHTSSSTGFGGAGGTASGGGGFGGAPSCDTLHCGFKKQDPLSGCLFCAEAVLCATEAVACDNDPECEDFRTCVSFCDVTDQACIGACRAMAPSGASLFAMFLQCAACSACATPCAGDPVMTLAMCGGSGGAGPTGGGGAGGVGGVGGVPTP